MENYLQKLQEDQEFQEKTKQMKVEVARANKVTADNKNFLGEMDTFLKELESWKTSRAMKIEDTECQAD